MYANQWHLEQLSIKVNTLQKQVDANTKLLETLGSIIGSINTSISGIIQLISKPNQ